MKKNPETHIRKLIASDSLRKALEALEDPALSLDEAMQDEVHLIQGRLSHLEGRVRKDLIPAGEANIERNQIRDSLLGLVSRIKDQPQQRIARKKKTFRWGFIGLGYFITAGLLLYYAFLPPASVKVVGKFLVSRLAFTSQEGKQLFSSQKPERLVLYHVSSLSFLGDSISVDSDFDSTFDITLSGNHRVQLQDELTGSMTLDLKGIQLEHLTLQDSARITLTQQSLENQSVFQWAMRQDSPVLGQLSYQDLELATGYADLHIETWEDSLPIEGAFMLRSHTNGSEEINFRQLPRSASMDLFVRENIRIPLPLNIDSLVFLKAEQNRTYSSIIGGTLSIPDTGKNELISYDFQYPDRLELRQEGPIHLQQLVLTDSGIFAHFTTEAKTIEKLKAGERIDLKPNRYKWIWHQYRTQTIAISAVVLAFLIFLPGPISKRMVEVIGTLWGWYKG